MKRSMVLSGKKRTLLSVLVLVVLLVAGMFAFHIGPFHQKQNLVAAGSSFNTKGEPKSKKASSQDSSSGDGDNSSSKSTGTSAVFVTPSGDFVSNHHPNLSGQPAPSSMSSVCNTTPGASCKITFTKDSTTRSLSVQTADANGATYWSWKLQDVGLTAGTWKIQAIATINGKTKTATDAMDLVVAQ